MKIPTYKMHFGFSWLLFNIICSEVRDCFQNFGNPEISGLGFSGFRITETSGIESFGIQDYRTSGFAGIPDFLGS